MDRNQPVTYNLLLWPFYTRWIKPTFPKMTVRVLKEAKNVNVSHIFDLTSRDEVACLLQSATMETKKIAGRWQNKITTCVEQICLLGVIRKVSNRKTLTDETFCFLEKRLLSIYTFFVSSNLLFFYELLICPQLLGCTMHYTLTGKILKRNSTATNNNSKKKIIKRTLPNK